jgi:hypothetical protein
MHSRVVRLAWTLLHDLVQSEAQTSLLFWSASR